MSGQVFEGIKVADFSWVGVGPLTAKYLADHGATVVHVESATRPETLRLAPPFRNDQPGINRSGFFANFNSSKLGAALNLSHPKGKEVARRLIQWADVMTESFTPGSMKRLGLDYASVVQFKPDIIYFSTCQLGQTGPWASQPGYGVQLAALSGFYHLAGWEDRDPAGPYGAFTDFINHRLGAVAVIAALDYRRRTGKGLYIDLSQLEGGIQFLAPLVMDALATGREHFRQGNRSSWAAPHNAYPCRGEDRWCVIAVETDEQWERLKKAMGSPAWSQNPRFAAGFDRKRYEEELDRHLEEWTKRYRAEELMALLQEAGVPAGVVETCEDLFHDPQLQHRGHFVQLDHLEIGRHSYDGVPFHLSNNPGGPKTAAPVLGQHSEYVYKKLLGMDPNEYSALEAEGMFV